MSRVSRGWDGEEGARGEGTGFSPSYRVLVLFEDGCCGDGKEEGGEASRRHTATLLIFIFRIGFRRWKGK